MMTAADIKTLYDAGAHFGYPRARRHPTATSYLYTTKDRTDIFDLEETQKRLDAARAFVAALSAQGKSILFVGGKHEAVAIVKDVAEKIGQPYVAGRWIGGTMTNFKNIRKRIERLDRLVTDRESGELEKKYTKKEQLLLSREVEGLEFRFGGITKMSDLPGALVIVDSRHEKTAVEEANQLKIPVIALSSSDCDFSKVQFPIPGNDSAVKSISLVLNELADAYQEGRRAPAAK
jgi:small subunit ribosomal protein S2